MKEEQHKMPQVQQGQISSAGKDDPRQAFEEGDPQVQGRSRGHIVDRDDPAGPLAPNPGGAEEDWESGRQDAMS